MTSPNERLLVEWLADGPDQGPPEPLERALVATRRTRKRPRWTFPERWVPMQLTMDRSPSLRPLLLLATVAILIAALAAAAIFIGSQRRVPEPFGLARNGAVVFERDGDLLIADELQGTGRVLVGGETRDSYPLFSNQGDRIAFIRSEPEGSFRLMSVRPDGSDLLELGGPFPASDGIRWAPDGSALMVSRVFPFSQTLVQADGSGTRPLDLGIDADLVSWRPDSERLVFRGQVVDGTQGAAVYLADPDGTDIQRLDLPGSKASFVDFEGLAWSPDGTRLSFMNDAVEGGDFDWQIGIAEVDPDGAVLSDRRLRFVADSTDEMLPVWSPDSERISFILERDGQRQIAIADPDATGATPVGPTTSASNGLGHAWSPDGRTLVISVLPRSGEQTFWSVDVESGATTQLDGPAVEIPAWQRLAP